MVITEVKKQRKIKAAAHAKPLQCGIISHAAELQPESVTTTAVGGDARRLNSEKK